VKRRGKLVVWPVYFDSTVSRGRGRKVPLRLSIPSPRIEELLKAAERLKLPHELVPDAAHPATPWKKTGYLLVEKRDSKTKILYEIAKELQSIRGRESH